MFGLTIFYGSRQEIKKRKKKRKIKNFGIYATCKVALVDEVPV